MSVRCLRIVGLAVFLAVSGAGAATWQSNFDTAKAQAAANGRPILMSFTCSDACPDCQQFRSTVLDAAAFQTFAESSLILMEVDLPRYRPLAALQQQANRQLAAKYSVSAYPTLLLVDASGKALTGVAAGGTADQFVASLNYTIAKLQEANPGSPPNHEPRPSDFPPEPVRDLPLFGGARTQPLPVYTNLVVKSISGSPSRRFALINSETLAAGDATWLKLGDRRIQVHCVEVREKSVLVRLANETVPRELPLAMIER